MNYAIIQSMILYYLYENPIDIIWQAQGKTTANINEDGC